MEMSQNYTKPYIDSYVTGQIIDISEIRKKNPSWKNIVTVWAVTHDLYVNHEIKVLKYDIYEAPEEYNFLKLYSWEGNKKQIIKVDLNEDWSIGGNQSSLNRLFFNKGNAEEYAIQLKMTTGSDITALPKTKKFVPELIDPTEDRNLRLISLIGFKGSGKDSVAKILIEKHGFKKESFAAPLKDITSILFDWDREMLEGETEESRQKREVVDTWWADHLGIPDWSPRKALQYMGTEVIRDNLHCDMWVFGLKRRIINSDHKRWVVTDCRFKNEINTTKDLGGITIRVKREEDPEWFNVAHVANTGKFPDGTPGSKEEAEKTLQFLNIHPSEYKWIGHEYDYVIHNNGDENNWRYLLECQVKEILDTLKIS